MNANYKYKIFEELDVNKMAPLYKSAFGLTIKLKDVTRKFFHPYQKIRSSFLALTEQNEPASFYGMITQKAIYNGSSFFVGQSCDSMTHKSHGGKGLFIKLAEKVYTHLQEQGVDYVYGFPNETIYNLRIKKLNWIHKEDINVYKIKVSTAPIAKVVKKLPALKLAYIRYLKAVLKKHLSADSYFENSVLQGDIAGIVHDNEYFNYKRGSDKFILKIEGKNFWIKIDGYLWVGDFENLSTESFSAALDVLKKIAIKTGCSSVVFRFQEDTPNDKLLQTICTVDSKMPLGYIDFNTADKIKTFKFTGSDFDSW